MSHTVDVAYPEFKQQPIAKKALLDAIETITNRNRNLIPVTGVEERTKGNIAVARLDGPRQQKVSLSVYGLVFVQNPDKDLVEILFEIASILNAKVYSERLKSYASPEDWEKRTTEYRKRRNDRLEKHSKRKQLNILGWMIFALLCFLSVLYMSIVNAV
jgi:hypothetical protein